MARPLLNAPAMRPTDLLPLRTALLSAALTACGATPATPATSDVPIARDAPAPSDVPTSRDVVTAPADAGDEFADVPRCNIDGFMTLRGPVYLGELPPSSLLVAGRPMLSNVAGPSSVSLSNAAGNAFLFRFDWSGMLRADQAADLTSAQIYLPADQGTSAPPLTGPWADQRICAGAGSRIVLRATGMQFILRNATITSGACPGGDPLGAEPIMGCYIPNIAP